MRRATLILLTALVVVGTTLHTSAGSAAALSSRSEGGCIQIGGGIGVGGCSIQSMELAAQSSDGASYRFLMVA